jgi:hypothetical protein
VSFKVQVFSFKRSEDRAEPQRREGKALNLKHEIRNEEEEGEEELLVIGYLLLGKRNKMRHLPRFTIFLELDLSGRGGRDAHSP